VRPTGIAGGGRWVVGKLCIFGGGMQYMSYASIVPKLFKLPPGLLLDALLLGAERLLTEVMVSRLRDDQEADLQIRT
jgi:hypothetical protein